MTIIINTYNAKPSHFFKIEIVKKTKHDLVKEVINKIQNKKFFGSRSAKKYIEKNPIPDFSFGKHNFLIHTPGKWVSDTIFEIKIKRKSNIRKIPLNTIYNIRYTLEKITK